MSHPSGKVTIPNSSRRWKNWRGRTRTCTRHTKKLTSSEEELRQNYEELSAREHELRESEEKYRNLVENTFDGVIIHRDKKVVCQQDCGQAPGLCGAEELIGRPILDMVHPDYLSLSAERAAQALETPQIPRHEKFFHRDGTVFDVKVVAIPTIWEGAPAVQVAFRDITGLKQAEEALKASEIFYRTCSRPRGLRRSSSKRIRSSAGPTKVMQR